uniref:FH2 domain-containing protein n=1 Tax=Heterorhabditis bacteriophora TaxID=37862 RepID=A0A1I7XKA9_HETBA
MDRLQRDVDQATVREIDLWYELQKTSENWKKTVTEKGFECKGKPQMVRLSYVARLLRPKYNWSRIVAPEDINRLESVVDPLLVNLRILLSDEKAHNGRFLVMEKVVETLKNIESAVSCLSLSSISYFILILFVSDYIDSIVQVAPIRCSPVPPPPPPPPPLSSLCLSSPPPPPPMVVDVGGSPPLLMKAFSLDFDMIDGMFSLSSSNLTPKSDVCTSQILKKKDTLVDLLTPKRSQNVTITLKQFKDLNCLVTDLREGKAENFDVDMLRTLKTILPDTEEV